MEYFNSNGWILIAQGILLLKLLRLSVPFFHYQLGLFVMWIAGVACQSYFCGGSSYFVVGAFTSLLMILSTIQYFEWHKGNPKKRSAFFLILMIMVCVMLRDTYGFLSWELKLNGEYLLPELHTFLANELGVMASYALLNALQLLEE